MKVSLVTTCLNEIRPLGRWRSDLEMQTRQPDEIVIVDAESSDGTVGALREWARQDDRVKVVVEKCSVARGRNVAIEAARHEYILSTDLGVRLDPGWVAAMVRPFADDPATEVVVGSYAVDRATVESAAARAEFCIDGDGVPFRTDEAGRVVLRKGVFPSNRSVAYLKRVWRELGGLPEDLTRAADDSVFGRQIMQGGYRVAFVPDALVYWSRHRKLREFWKEQRVYGRGDGEAGIKMPAAFRLYRKRLVPRFIVPLMVGLRTMTKQVKLRRLWRALCDGDVLACIYMPILSFGNGYAFGQGYVAGYEYGTEHCRECRARVAGRQSV